MLKIAKDLFDVRYAKFKRDNKNTLTAIAFAAFAATMFILGIMIARWPKGQWPRR